MTVNVDYTQIDPEPLPLLWLAYDLHEHSLLPWLILNGNQDDHVYCRAPSLDAAIRFVRAAVKNGDATADEDSIEFQRMFRASFGHSVRVPSPGRGPASSPIGDPAGSHSASESPVSSAVIPSDEPTPLPDPFSNVLPFRLLEPCDEEVPA